MSDGSDERRSVEHCKWHGSESGPTDKALATIVFFVDPSLLYLIGDSENPVLVWKKLGDQFKIKTWANKLLIAQRWRLSPRTHKDNDRDLSLIRDTVEDDDRVVYLLASLPDSYNTLVTALEANTEVSKMEVVTERLLPEQQKLKKRGGSSCGGAEAMFSKQKSTRRGPKCNFFKRFGHIQ